MTPPENTTPENATPDQTAPNRPAPETAAPTEQAPARPTPDEAVPDQEAVSDQKAVSDEPAPDGTTPEQGPWTRVEPFADGQAVAVRVGGDVDQTTVEVLDQGLDEALAKAIETGALLVVVDLQEVGFVASTGLSSLIRVHNAAKDKGLELVVVLPDEHRLSRLLWLTALSRILTVTSSVEEALKHAPRNPA